jgi:PAS domain S-box-containing protein
MPDAVIISDQEGRIVRVNSQAERLFGYAREQLIQQSVEKLIPERFRTQHAKHRKDYSKKPFHRPMGTGLELVGQRADGTEFPVEISLGVLQIEAGILTCSAIRDVTERKQSENALKRTAAELARSNAELEQFAYAVSHDLQEPLRTVTGATQILARDYAPELNSESRQWLGFAMDGSKRMQEMLDGLLNYARLRAERRPFELVDCERVYQAAVANLSMAIAESGAELNHGPLPLVLGDSVQLTQLFQNLLGNAIKFRRQVPPKVHVSAQQQNRAWRVAVRDNGIGIDAKHFGRLFSLFHRLHTREQYSGTGIGLAICTKIVELHGGEMGVDSTPGEGSSFFFTIPMVDPAALPLSSSTSLKGNRSSA